MTETKGVHQSSKTEAENKDLWATPQEIVDGLFSYVENKRTTVRDFCAELRYSL